MNSTTNQKSETIISTYFKHGVNGKLAIFPRKESKRLVILRHLSNRFVSNREYSEQEVNGILGMAYHDHVTLRRNLVEYGFMERLPDGSKYWIKKPAEPLLDNDLQR